MLARAKSVKAIHSSEYNTDLERWNLSLSTAMCRTEGEKVSLNSMAYFKNACAKSQVRSQGVPREYRNTMEESSLCNAFQSVQCPPAC